ncbi:hypothetical protein SeMB42_g04868 [Synchytrium endobioticum]|uniref:Uncharacterized protein n=1 Tax=Synchytrium endobioticum TaxID=286115 RepID=A0A507CV87_9FUNG|nr:hypothetical protein SeMB42_g04868 [Synchytrium endobioticum]
MLSPEQKGHGNIAGARDMTGGFSHGILHNNALAIDRLISGRDHEYYLTVVEQQYYMQHLSTIQRNINIPKVISHIIQTMGVKYGWKMILGLNVVTAILSATELFSIFTRPVKEPVSESSDDGDEPMTFEGMHRDWLDDREPPSDIECPSSSDDNDANENNPTDHVNIEDIRYIYVDVLGCFYPEILRCCSGSNPDEPLNLYPLIHMIEGMFPTGPTW